MRKLNLFKMLLVTAMLCLGSNAWADDVTSTWKATSSTATAASTQLLKNEGIKATTYFATTKQEESQTIAGTSFSHYIQVRNAEYPTIAVPQGTENSGSTSIELDVTYGGTLTLYYMRQSTAQSNNKGTYASNDGKDLKVFKQSDASVLSGTLTIDSEASDGKNGWATKVVTLEAGTKYTISAKGTTIRFYGFNYSVSWEDSWSRTFDDAYGVSEFTGSVELQNRSNSDATKVAAAFASGSKNDIGYTFPSLFTSCEKYEFSFDLAMSAVGNTKNTVLSEFTLTSSESAQLFKLKSAGNNGNHNILVYIGTSTDELSKDKTEGEYTANCLYGQSPSGSSGSNNKPKASNWYTIKISASPTKGTWVSFTPKFTQSGYSTIEKKISDDVLYIGNMSATTGVYYGCIWLDNFDLKQIIPAGFVAAPEYVITAPENTNRKFELSCSTDDATIYWATSELAKDAAGWTAYASTAVSTNAATIYAYAKKGDNTSNIINFSTGAGTTVNLLAATLSHTAADKYTITNDQSSLLGSPTATVHYQIDGGAEQTSTSTAVEITISEDGTLTYWLTATGYGSTSPANETVYAEVAYANSTTIDLCTNTSTSDAKWAYNNTNSGTPYSEYSVTTDDTGHSYYKYMDESGNIVGDGLLAVSAQNEASSWRVQKSKGGTAPYNKTEYVAVLDLKAGQIVQIKCNSTPGIVSSNISAIPASSYTGTYSYLVNSDGDAIISLARSNTLKKIYLCSTTVSGTITSAGWSTFASPYALDLSTISGGTAYYASAASGSTVTLTSTTQTVQAGEGIMVKGTAGETFTIGVAASGTAISGNLLKGQTTTGDVAASTDGTYHYVFGFESASKYGFYNLTAATSVAAGKAYLETTSALTSGGSRLSIVFDDEVTGINDVKANMSDGRGEYINLQGQRVDNPKKGLYIVNGMKINMK